MRTQIAWDRGVGLRVRSLDDEVVMAVAAEAGRVVILAAAYRTQTVDCQSTVAAMRDFYAVFVRAART